MALLLVNLCVPQRSYADVPDWLRAVATVPLPPHDEDVQAVKLYSETVLTVTGPGKIHAVHRAAYRVLRPGSEVGRVDVTFDPQQPVLDIRGWSLPQQGKAYEVRRKDAIEHSIDVADGVLVGDARILTLRIPAADPGSVVGYEYEQQEAPYFMGEDWDFQDTVPTREAHFTLQMPAGWTWKNFWINHPSIEPVRSGANTWSWVVGEQSAIRIERAMPPWRGVAGRMFVTVAPPGANASGLTWEGIGTWYYGLAQPGAATNPEISRKVSELTAGQSDTFARLQALARFVQKDVRYVAIELGIGGHQPHAAAETFANRFGDCKDKALLLGTMLREIGVQSYAVIINTERGSVNAATPPNLEFNHVILAIRLPEDVNQADLTGAMNDPQLGRLLFFDPTNDKIPLGRLGGYLQANYGLLVTANGGRLMQLPQAPGSTGIVRTARLSLDAAGRLSGAIEESWLGDAGWLQREVQAGTERETDRIRPVEAVVSQSLANYRIVKAAVRNVQRTDQPFGWVYEVDAPGYAKVSGDLLLVRPRVLGVLSSALLETKHPRENAMEFEVPERNSDTFEIRLPEGYVVDELPDAMDVDTGFAAYHSRTELTGGSLRYTRTFEVKELSVSASRADELRRLYRLINDDERRVAILKRVGT